MNNWLIWMRGREDAEMTQEFRFGHLGMMLALSKLVTIQVENQVKNGRGTEEVGGNNNKNR